MGKVKRIGYLDGPQSGTNTGSIVCTYGTSLKPKTTWWVGSQDVPPTAPGSTHEVSESLSEVVTGIPTGIQTVHFATARPNSPPCRTKVSVEKGRTTILEVKYRER
jgi:hypothetical protein